MRFSRAETTQYPTTQDEVDFHQRFRFPFRNRGPFLTEDEATSELVARNDPTSREVPQEELAAMDRLWDAVTDFEDGYQYGPDLAIKAFSDLDTVFFAGRLRGNVIVRWFDCVENQAHECCLGLTEEPRPLERGQTRIKLNVGMIFDQLKEEEPFRLMFSTLLHEMCHAYDTVVCPEAKPLGGDGMGHDEHFETRIRAVDENAIRILGLAAIDEWERHTQRPVLLAADDEGEGVACGCEDCENHGGMGETVTPVRGNKKGRSGRRGERDGRKGRKWGFRVLPPFNRLFKK